MIVAIVAASQDATIRRNDVRIFENGPQPERTFLAVAIISTVVVVVVCQVRIVENEADLFDGVVDHFITYQLIILLIRQVLVTFHATQ